MGRASRRRAASRSRIRGAGLPAADGGEQSPIGAAEPRSHPTASLGELAEAAERRQRLEVEIDELVQQLVARGAGWGDIGRALGISRQGARQRYTRR